MDEKTRKAIQAELEAAKAITNLAMTEERGFTGDEQGRVAAHLKLAADLKARSKDADELRKQLNELSDSIGLDEPTTEKAQPGQYNTVNRDKGNGNTPHKGFGQAFVDSPEFKALVNSVPEGRFGEKARVQSQPFGVKDLITGVNRTTSAGTLLTPQNLGLVDLAYQRPLSIRDLVTPGVTGTDTIDYVRLVSVTNNAAPVAEATSAGPISATAPIVTPAQAGVKPESGLLLERATTNVKTIAHWIPATKRALSDVGQIRTLIDAFLLYGLDEALEDQIVSGDGQGENFLGIAGTSGVQTQAAPGVGETVLDITRKARTKVRIGGRSVPTAYVMNPIDWQAVDLLKDTTDRYYGAGPFQMTTPMLWGLPVVESEAIPAGTAYVGDWRKAVLWDREQASIQVTDSHSDFFIRNLVAILAELRAAFAVLRPSAFVKITL
jgi:HK97 family phage major capsid protein